MVENGVCREVGAGPAGSGLEVAVRDGVEYMVEAGVGRGTDAGLNGAGLEVLVRGGLEKRVEENVIMEDAGLAGVALGALVPTSGGKEAKSGGVGAGGGVSLLSSSSPLLSFPLSPPLSLSLSLLLPSVCSLLSTSGSRRRPRKETLRSAVSSSTTLPTNISSTFPIHKPT